MNLVLDRETPPLYEDETGAVASWEFKSFARNCNSSISRWSIPLSLSFIVTRLYPYLMFYNTIGYYLRHQDAVEAYLTQREQLAEAVQQRLFLIFNPI